ncbi:MAG: helix-turn-helix domain-containing protein [Microbacterium sp.]
MSRRTFGEFSCSIARTVDVIGDAWTPLVLRDLFLGVDTFDELVRDLGISRALLSARLAHLTENEIVEGEIYSEHPPRRHYRLTRAGRDLVPVLIALMQWGDRWRAPAGPPLLLEHECGHVLTARLRCDECGTSVEAASVSALPGPGGRRSAGTAVLAERLAAIAEPSSASKEHRSPANEDAPTPHEGKHR